MYIPCACSHSKTHHTFCFPSISLSISTDCTLLVSRVSDAVLFSRSARSGTFFSLVCVCVKRHVCLFLYRLLCATVSNEDNKKRLSIVTECLGGHLALNRAVA